MCYVSFREGIPPKLNSKLTKNDGSRGNYLFSFFFWGGGGPGVCSGGAVFESEGLVGLVGSQASIFTSMFLFQDELRNSRWLWGNLCQNLQQKARLSEKCTLS